MYALAVLLVRCIKWMILSNPTYWQYFSLSMVNGYYICTVSTYVIVIFSSFFKFFPVNSISVNTECWFSNAIFSQDFFARNVLFCSNCACGCNFKRSRYFFWRLADFSSLKLSKIVLIFYMDRINIVIHWWINIYLFELASSILSFLRYLYSLLGCAVVFGNFLALKKIKIS